MRRAAILVVTAVFFALVAAGGTLLQHVQQQRANAAIESGEVLPLSVELPYLPQQVTLGAAVVAVVLLCFAVQLAVHDRRARRLARPASV